MNINAPMDQKAAIEYLRTRRSGSDDELKKWLVQNCGTEPPWSVAEIDAALAEVKHRARVRAQAVAKATEDDEPVAGEDREMGD